MTNHNRLELIDELWLECAKAKHSFDFSGKLCDALEICYKALGHPVKNWRKHALPEVLVRKDRPDAMKTNYDFNVIHGDIPSKTEL